MQRTSFTGPSSPENQRNQTCGDDFPFSRPVSMAIHVVASTLCGMVCQNQQERYFSCMRPIKIELLTASIFQPGSRGHKCNFKRDSNAMFCTNGTFCIPRQSPSLGLYASTISAQGTLLLGKNPVFLFRTCIRNVVLRAFLSREPTRGYSSSAPHNPFCALLQRPHGFSQTVDKRECLFFRCRVIPKNQRSKPVLYGISPKVLPTHEIGLMQTQDDARAAENPTCINNEYRTYIGQPRTSPGFIASQAAATRVFLVQPRFRIGGR